jgi:protein tyrosine phosphatase (PTP) superfamily phosphohydrolase (DUF442 family)
VIALGALAWWLGPSVFGRNLHTVIPGEVFRSAQLSAHELGDTLGDLEIRSVVSLRYADEEIEWYAQEKRIAEARGAGMHGLAISAKRLPSRQKLRRLLEILDTAERPVLLHCRAGTERTGLAASLAALLEGNDLPSARDQFSLRFGYVSGLSSSDLPRWIDLYEAWLANRGEDHAPERLRRFVWEGYVPYFYDASIEVASLPESVRAGESHPASFRVTNTSPLPWRLSAGTGRGVQLGVEVASLDPALDFLHRRRSEAPADALAPGETAEFPVQLPRFPAAGRYRLTVDLVDLDVIWFEEMGSTPLEIVLRVLPPDGEAAAPSPARSAGALPSPGRPR